MESKTKRFLLIGIVVLVFLFSFVSVNAAYDLRLTNPIYAESVYVSQTNVTQMNVLMYNATNNELIDFIGFFNGSNTTFYFYPFAEINISLISNYADDPFYSEINLTNFENPFANVTQWIENNQSWANFTYQWNTTGFVEGIYNLTFFVRNETIQPGFVMGRDSLTLFVNLTNYTEPINQTPPAPSEEPATQTPAHRGGGGGGGTVSTTSKLFAEITSEGVTFIPIGSVVNEVFVSTKTTLINIRISVDKATAEQVPTIIPTEVYSYLQIISSGLSDEDIALAKIKFKTDKAWSSNKTVALYRYVGEKWNKLSTIQTNLDDNYIYYEADSPGFSYFAIAEEVKTEETSATETIATEIVTKEVETEAFPVTSAATGVLFGAGKYSWLIALLVVALVIGYFLILKRKKI